MAATEASTTACRRIDRAQWQQSIELRKTEKPRIVLIFVIASEYESSFRSPALAANICMADMLAPPLQEKVNGKKVAFSTSSTRCPCFIFRWFPVIYTNPYAFWATLDKLIKHFDIKTSLDEARTKQPICSHI